MHRSRFLSRVGVGSAALLIFMVSDSARALLFAPAQSSLSVRIGALPALEIAAGNDAAGASLSIAGSQSILSVQAGLFTTPSALVMGGGQTALFSGLPVLSRLTGSASNRSGAFTLSLAATSASGWQGAMGIDGALAVHVAGAPAPIPLALSSLSGFTPGSVVLTGISTPRVSIPARSGATGALITLRPTSMESVVPVSSSPYVITQLTFSGSSSATSTPSGAAFARLNMLKPIRVVVGQTPVPGLVRARLVFVPEPTGLLLGLASVTTLSWLGWRRHH